MKLYHMCIVFFGISEATSSSYEQTFWTGRSYHESCSNDEPCIATRWLTCQEGICQCAHPDEMVYDFHSLQCVAKSGYSCLRQLPALSSSEEEMTTENEEVTEAMGSSTLSDDAELPGIEENEIESGDPPQRDQPKIEFGGEAYYVSCVPNAKCNYPEDVCRCDFHYYEIRNGSCLEQNGYNEPCQADQQCDQFRFFSCVAGRCACDDDHQYDRKNNRCIKPVGTDCTVIDYVNINDVHFKGHECPEHALCVDGKCQCEKGYLVTEDKTCGIGYGDFCDSEHTCSDVQFSCRNQSCQCKYPIHQYYDEASDECVSLVNGPCSSFKEINRVDFDPELSFVQKCTENAICKDSSPYSFCECKAGYVETDDGTCVKSYKSACELDSECDQVPPLKCVQNICQCSDLLQVYDEKHRKCVALAGTRCYKDDSSTGAVCTANSFCFKPNSQLKYGKCVCIRPAVMTSERSCRK